MATFTLMAGAFCTINAAEQDYKFTIVQGATSSNNLTSEQVKKEENSLYAYVRVASASAPSYYTTYMVYCYNDLVSNAVEVINKKSYYGYPKYITGAERRKQIALMATQI